MHGRTVSIRRLLPIGIVPRRKTGRYRQKSRLPPQGQQRIIRCVSFPINPFTIYSNRYDYTRTDKRKRRSFARRTFLSEHVLNHGYEGRHDEENTRKDDKVENTAFILMKRSHLVNEICRNKAADTTEDRPQEGQQFQYRSI